MKWVLLLVFFLLAFLMLYNDPNKKKSLVSQLSIPVQRDSTLLVNFKDEIEPILKARCSPCHFPGGKLYDKLPFDNPQTIKDHPEGILKRIKAVDDARKIKAFLKQKDH